MVLMWLLDCPHQSQKVLVVTPVCDQVFHPDCKGCTGMGLMDLVWGMGMARGLVAVVGTVVVMWNGWGEGASKELLEECGEGDQE
jgi:hypothetical protein